MVRLKKANRSYPFSLNYTQSGTCICHREYVDRLILHLDVKPGRHAPQPQLSQSRIIQPLPVKELMCSEPCSKTSPNAPPTNVPPNVFLRVAASPTQFASVCPIDLGDAVWWYTYINLGFRF